MTPTSTETKPESTVYFATCGNCAGDIYKADPRKWVSSEKEEKTGIPDGWYHIACYQTTADRLKGKPTAQTPKAQSPSLLEDILKEYVERNSLKPEMLKAMVAQAVKEIVPITMSIEVKRETGEPITIKGVHKCFPDLLELLKANVKNVYLYGSPGSGKSTAVMQCAEAMGLQYGYISLNPQTPESRLFGFNHAGGDYVRTEFFKFYTEGGIYFIDELDNGAPSLQTTLNNFLENGNGSFPCGTVKRHRDFFLITAGNTNGNGGNYQFPDRRAFDPAFKERFTFLKWEYDTALEKAVTLQINPDAFTWLEWVGKVRDFVQKEEIQLVVSPRASYNGANLLRSKAFKQKEVAEMVIWKGLDKDIIKRIMNAIPFEGKPKEEVATNENK